MIPGTLPGVYLTEPDITPEHFKVFLPHKRENKKHPLLLIGNSKGLGRYEPGTVDKGLKHYLLINHNITET